MRVIRVKLTALIAPGPVDLVIRPELAAIRLGLRPFLYGAGVRLE
jgi:hypothetical protein